MTSQVQTPSFQDLFFFVFCEVYVHSNEHRLFAWLQAAFGCGDREQFSDLRLTRPGGTKRRGGIL